MIQFADDVGGPLRLDLVVCGSLDATQLGVTKADAEAINFGDEPIKFGEIPAAHKVQTCLVLQIYKTKTIK